MFISREKFWFDYPAKISFIFLKNERKLKEKVTIP
jgi:hypothetical protein